MRWIAALTLVFLIGCATPQKRVHHAHRKHKSTKVIAVGDDAAIDAIIKSLRE